MFTPPQSYLINKALPILLFLAPVSTIWHSLNFLYTISISILGVYCYFKYDKTKSSLAQHKIACAIAFTVLLFIIVFVAERFFYLQTHTDGSFFKPLDSYFRLLLLVPIMFVPFRLKTDFKYFAYGLVATSIIMLIISAYQVLILRHERAFGFYTFYNLYGVVHIINALLMIWLHKKISLTWIIIGVFSSVVCCVLTGTRGAILAIPLLLVLGMFYYFDGVKKTSQKNIFKTLIILGVCVLCAVFVLPKKSTSERYTQALSEFKLTFQGDGSATSVGARIEMWKIGWQILQKTPFSGNGAGSFHAELKKLAADKIVPEAYAQFKGPHNLYVLILAEHGLVIGGAFLLFLLSMPLLLYKAIAKTTKNYASKNNELFLLTVFTVFFMIFFLSESILERHQGMHFFAGIWFFLIGTTLKTNAFEDK